MTDDFRPFTHCHKRCHHHPSNKPRPERTPPLPPDRLVHWEHCAIESDTGHQRVSDPTIIGPPRQAIPYQRRAFGRTGLKENFDGVKRVTDQGLVETDTNGADEVDGVMGIRHL